MKYAITKKQCQSNIRGVCEGCGGKLEPLRTVDNSGSPTFWVGCKECSRFRCGVEKRYFLIARKCIEENIIKPYSMVKRDYENTPEQLKYYLDSQTAGLSHVIQLIDKLLKDTQK